MADQPELKIVYQDEVILAVNKPAGLLVHPTPIDAHASDSVVKRLKRVLDRPLHSVHRLDKGTAGILLLTLDADAARHCTEAFTTRKVKKTYLAVVRGFTDPDGEIDHPLSPVKDRRRKGRKEERKPAVTRFRRLAKVQLPIPISRYPTARYSLLALYPRTGRMHQLRRHCKHIRSPIIGDTWYGDQQHNRYFRESLDCRRLLLAATELELPHPVRDETLRLVAPLDDDFCRILETMGWKESIPAEWLNEAFAHH